MGIDSLAQILLASGSVLLDTMVFSYHLGGNARYLPLTRLILEAIEAGEMEGLTTTLTLVELLTRPAQEGNTKAMREYELLLTQFPNLIIVPLDVPLAREAATIRATTCLRLPDAIQIGAARLHNVGAVVTNDRRWLGKVESLRLIILDDHVGQQ